MRRLVLMGLVIGLLIPWLGACQGERPRPPRQTPVPVATLVPTRVPWPTLGPSFDFAGQTAPGSAQDADAAAETGERGLPSAPAAPVLLSGRSIVLTVSDDGERWEGDVLLRWRHANPPGVDYYEVRHGLNAPYSNPDLDGTTTALRFLSDAPGQDFVYLGGTAGATIAGDLDTYTVRACNRAGCSAASNEIGVMSFSLRQGIPELPNY